MIFQYIPWSDKPGDDLNTQRTLHEFFKRPRSIQEILLFWLKDKRTLSFARVCDQNEHRLYASFEQAEGSCGYASTPLSELRTSLPSITYLTNGGTELQQDTVEASLLARNESLNISSDSYTAHTFSPPAALDGLILQYATSHGGLATVELSTAYPGLGSILLIFSPDAIDRDDDFDPETECLGWHESSLFSMEQLQHYCILDAATPGAYPQ